MIVIKDTIDFIKRMRRLIREDRYLFENRTYDGLDYVAVLLEDFMITPDEAIEHLKTLNSNMWVLDNMPDYKSSGAFIFKKTINKVLAYIKLNIEYDENGEVLVIISFHRDNK